jgi:hypothetical protein
VLFLFLNGCFSRDLTRKIQDLEGEVKRAKLDAQGLSDLLARLGDF